MSWTRQLRRNERAKGPGRSRQGGSGGRSVFEMDEWRPPTDEKGEWVRFYAGVYSDCEECGAPVSCNEDGQYICQNLHYDGEGNVVKDSENKWQACDHEGVVERGLPVQTNYSAFIPTGGKRGKGDSVPCNCMDGRLSRPCTTCAEIEKGTFKDVKIRERTAYNMIRLGKFHAINKTSKKGREYQIRVPCTASRVSKCEACDEGRPKVRGKRAYYNPGFGHNGQLQAIDKALGTKCLSCEEGQIQIIGYECPHCKEVGVNLFETSLSAEDQKAYDNDAITCPSCGAQDYQQEILECIIEDDQGEVVEGCEAPVRTSIFDVDLRLRRAPEKEGKDKSKTVLTQVDIRGPKPIDENVLDQVDPYSFMFLTQVPPFRQASRMNLKGQGSPGATRSAQRSSTVSYK